MAPEAALERAPLAVPREELEAARAAADGSLAWSYLSQLPLIRAYVSAAPGYGNQWATISILRRLRDLGYAGELEAVYDGDPGKGELNEATAAKYKLPVLLPGFDPALEDQRIPGLGVRARTVASLGSHERAALALTGGDDVGRGSRGLLKADAYLRLSPMGWNLGNDSVATERETRTLADDTSRPQMFVYRPADPREPPRPQETASLSPEKARGVRALLDAAPGRAFMPAYGLARYDEGHLHRLLLGVSEAMERRPEAFPRGAVVPFLLDDARMAAGLERLVSDPARAAAPPLSARAAAVADAVVANRRLARRLRSVSVEDPALPAILAGLGEGDILFVRTGSVPPGVFERMFALATLPPVIEGRNARNLAQLTGRPFLPNYDFDFLDVYRAMKGTPGSAAARSAMRAAVDALNDQAGYSFLPLADFMLGVLDGSLQPGFARARVRQDDLGRDKLFTAVLELLEMLGLLS